MKINTPDDLLVTSVIFVIAFGVSLCVVKGNNGIRRSLYFTEDSKKSNSRVLEGDTIDLICQQHITDECQIWGDNIEYVNNGYLSPSLPDNIIFNRTDSACILTIINVSRDNQDDFNCKNPGVQYLILKVINSPPEEYPRCTSNYELPIVFSDQLQVPFDFNCTTEKGNPVVNISLYVETDGRQQQVNSTIDLISTGRQLSKSRSFSTYLDSSFNNSSLICRVIQQLPAPYQSYNKSCSFGPLVILSTCSVSINQSHYTVNTNKRENITLTCTSNVSGVVLEWTDIPLEDWQYNITNINDSLQLNIFDYGSSIDGLISINCSGSYGGRTVCASSALYLVVKGCLGTPIPCSTLQYLIPVIIVIVVSVVIIIVYRNSKRRQRKELKPTAEPTNSLTQNNNNTNDLGLSSSTADEGNSLNPIIAGSSQEDTEMVDNPIYGSKPDKSPTQINTQVDSVSYKSISITDMTDNLLYEACNPRVTILQDDNDDNYAIVSI